LHGYVIPVLNLIREIFEARLRENSQPCYYAALAASSILARAAFVRYLARHQCVC
jgi:hypothetical protein